MYGLASAASSLLAGWLAGALSGLHLSFGGMVFGPVDTILGVAGLAVIAGGLSARGALDTVTAVPEAEALEA
jgi:hypothetical protein